ncbi:MAG TPA: phosphate ABC transporter substrate-binding protein PstS [Verrucomicrobiae bacterium]|jgi:phosphate transport system substrate-binding protein|nr:phosphate ABC transporter substrate-binding protein PstS [Verrucomicrobiae bacterium]
MRIAKLIGVLAVVLALASTLALAEGQVLLNAAGATFPYPIYSKWFDVYHQAHSNVQINYQSIGSGGGIRQLLDKTVDFGASDGPMNDDQLKQSSVPILHFPTVLGAAVPSYNVAGVQGDLNFTPEALSGIFLGKVTKWNDPAIAGANPGIKLPGDDIVVVHRSDGSGTSYIWTDYLSKVSPDWQTKVGKGTSVNWPAGLGGKGNEGVSALIQQTPGSLGYVELIYAVQNKIPYGKVKNSSGAFVKADLASVSAAAAAAAKFIPDDFRVSITNPEGKAAYPIASFTWLLIPSKFADAAKRDVVKDFLKWALTDGQQYCEALAYAKLPKEVVAKEMKAIAQIQ